MFPIESESNCGELTLHAGRDLRGRGGFNGEMESGEVQTRSSGEDTRQRQAEREEEEEAIKNHDAVAAKMEVNMSLPNEPGMPRVVQGNPNNSWSPAGLKVQNTANQKKGLRTNALPDQGCHVRSGHAFRGLHARPVPGALFRLLTQ